MVCELALESEQILECSKRFITTTGEGEGDDVAGSFTLFGGYLEAATQWPADTTSFQ